jgi:hypothetical protein
MAKDTERNEYGAKGIRAVKKNHPNPKRKNRKRRRKKSSG